jgi:hypothetical protein
MQLNTEEIVTAFRLHVAGSGAERRDGCPSADEIGATFLPTTPEDEKLRVVDHLSTCLSCARDFEVARRLYAGHERIAPMLPERWESDGVAPSNVVRFPEARQESRWRTILKPGFALAAAAGLAFVFVAGALLSHMLGSGRERLVALAPVDRATSARLELSWRPLAAAASYDVTMSWPSGKVFYESGPVSSTTLTVPSQAVAKMKRGQTCLWTLMALDAEGRELARETFSFVVDFDPADA